MIANRAKIHDHLLEISLGSIVGRDPVQPRDMQPTAHYRQRGQAEYLGI